MVEAEQNWPAVVEFYPPHSERFEAAGRADHPATELVHQEEDHSWPSEAERFHQVLVLPGVAYLLVDLGASVDPLHGHPEVAIVH